MGQIRTYQTDYLRTGSEQINYKRFDNDGVYIETVDDNILVNCPTDVVPLDRSLQKLYDKPLNKVKFTSTLIDFNPKTSNSQFLFDDEGWILPDPGTGQNVAQAEVVEATAFSVKPLTGNKYLQAQGSNVSKTIIRSDSTETLVRQSLPIVIAFSYYLQNNSNTITDFRYEITAKIDASANGTMDHIYNFDTKEWEAFTSQSYNHQILNNVTDKWIGFSKTIEPFFYRDAQGDLIDVLDKRIEISISYPNGAALADVTYIDNFSVSEKIEANFAKITNIRERFSYDNGYTGEYETESIMSNELKNNESFFGRIDGNYKRQRDGSSKSLEAIITQEIINDSRDHLTKYEGDFRNVGENNVGLHNKIWVDFGADILEEPVSCYIDAMTFNVKKGNYQIRMHVPNQDDDYLTTYKSIAE